MPLPAYPKHSAHQITAVVVTVGYRRPLRVLWTSFYGKSGAIPRGQGGQLISQTSYDLA